MKMHSDSLYIRQLVRGFFHLYNGQEFVAVCTEAAVTYDDFLIAAYRNHCQQLARLDSVTSKYEIEYRIGVLVASVIYGKYCLRTYRSGRMAGHQSIKCLSRSENEHIFIDMH